MDRLGQTFAGRLRQHSLGPMRRARRSHHLDGGLSKAVHIQKTICGQRSPNSTSHSLVVLARILFWFPLPLERSPALLSSWMKSRCSSREVIDRLASHGLRLGREQGDHEDVPIDSRYLDLPRRAAEDPEVSLGSFAKGVWVGPGDRLPRQLALHVKKNRWSLTSQRDPLDHLEEAAECDSSVSGNYMSVAELSGKVLEVLQSSRGQVLRMPEPEARMKYPDLVVASLGALRKDELGGIVTARVPFDGTASQSIAGRESETKKGHQWLHVSNEI